MMDVERNLRIAQEHHSPTSSVHDSVQLPSPPVAPPSANGGPLEPPLREASNFTLPDSLGSIQRIKSKKGRPKTSDGEVQRSLNNTKTSAIENAAHFLSLQADVSKLALSVRILIFNNIFSFYYCSNRFHWICRMI
jgi:hypothetical protein